MNAPRSCFFGEARESAESSGSYRRICPASVAEKPRLIKIYLLFSIYYINRLKYRVASVGEYLPGLWDTLSLSICFSVNITWGWDRFVSLPRLRSAMMTRMVACGRFRWRSRRERPSPRFAAHLQGDYRSYGGVARVELLADDIF